MSKISGQRFSIWRAAAVVFMTLAGLVTTCIPSQAVAERECLYLSEASADSVYDQALSTVRTLTQEALKAKRSGAWRPDGSFAQPFFNQSGRALRDMRSLLDQIFQVSFPRGLRQLARRQRGERRKFIAEIDALPTIMSECAG